MSRLLDIGFMKKTLEEDLKLIDKLLLDLESKYLEDTF